MSWMPSPFSMSCCYPHWVWMYIFWNGTGHSDELRRSKPRAADIAASSASASRRFGVMKMPEIFLVPLSRRRRLFLARRSKLHNAGSFPCVVGSDLQCWLSRLVPFLLRVHQWRVATINRFMCIGHQLSTLENIRCVVHLFDQSVTQTNIHEPSRRCRQSPSSFGFARS